MGSPGETSSLLRGLPCSPTFHRVNSASQPESVVHMLRNILMSPWEQIIVGYLLYEILSITVPILQTWMLGGEWNHIEEGTSIKKGTVNPDQIAQSGFSSVTQSCPTLGDPMDCSMPGFPVHHQLPEFTQTHVHQVGDATQSSHYLLSPSPSAFNLSQLRGLFKWVSSFHQAVKVLEFQL